MRVKQYIVETMPEAMLQIRKDLGGNAVILSTKEIKVGGMMGMFRKKRIEVVAAVEEEDKKKPRSRYRTKLRQCLVRMFLKRTGRRPVHL